MKNIYSIGSKEKIAIHVESSPVWEVILGIAAYTHKQMRHTFERDAIWTSWDKQMPASLYERLKVAEETNLWYGLIMLQAKISSSTLREFSNSLSAITPSTFYETLLPYKNRECEEERKLTAENYMNKSLFINYSKHFINHDYLEDYIVELSHFRFEEICAFYQSIVNEWYQWVSVNEDWQLWMSSLDFEKTQYQSIETNHPTDMIKLISGIENYIPEPSIWTIKLVPHISYRPWILELRTSDTKLIFYPLKEEYFTQPGEPSNELIAGHKALGDETRLKILYQLQKGPMSLQDLSVQFLMSKTTLHHQLSILKSAKFIRADKGIYSFNGDYLKAFSSKLFHYLGSQS